MWIIWQIFSQNTSLFTLAACSNTFATHVNTCEFARKTNSSANANKTNKNIMLRLLNVVFAFLTMIATSRQPIVIFTEATLLPWTIARAWLLLEHIFSAHRQGQQQRIMRMNTFIVQKVNNLIDSVRGSPLSRFFACSQLLHCPLVLNKVMPGEFVTHIIIQ